MTLFHRSVGVGIAGWLLAGCAQWLNWSDPAHAISHSAPLRILVYSDPQMCDDAQASVARGMAARNTVAPFDFAVSVGDNIATSIPDVMSRCFETPYAQLIAKKIVFYAGIGNHDVEDNRIATELDYSRRMNVEARGVGGFSMPSENFVIRRANLKWIVINVAQADGSIGFTEATRTFAERELCESTRDWKVVAFRYPLWSSGMRGDSKAMQEIFLPILSRCRVDFVFSGHEHHAELLAPWNWATFAIVGNSSQVRPPSGSSAQESLFRSTDLGFSELEINADVAQLAFFNERGEERHRTSFQKRAPFWCDTWRQEGAKILGRIKLDVGVTVERVTAEIGLSTTALDPLILADRWRFTTAFYRGNAGAPDLFAFAGDVPSGEAGGYAVFRYRIDNGPWIYGDLSDAPGLHGNYDGIQVSHLLKVK